MTDTVIELTTSQGETLQGLRSWPAEIEVRNSAVVLVHGFVTGKHDAGFDQLTTALTELGIIVYRFDFSGCGASTGDMYDTSLVTRVAELREIVEYVASEGNVDPERIAAVGQSLGSTTVLGCPELFKAIVLTCPLHDPADTLSHLFGDGYNPTGDSVRVRTDGDHMKMGSQLWPSLDTVVPLSIIKEISAPLLIVAGQADEIILPANVEKLAAAAPAGTESRFIPEMHHNWSPKGAEICRLVSSWLVDRL